MHLLNPKIKKAQPLRETPNQKKLKKGGGLSVEDLPPLRLRLVFISKRRLLE
jgi:hypothetical protein